jgi:NADPH:quinone reductase
MTSNAETSYAVQITGYGAPEVLTYVSISNPPLQPNEVRIRTIAAAVNHTDLEIRSGNWPIRKSEPFPYVPGVEVVGKVKEIGTSVHGLRIGERVITMMQGLGGVRAERPGAYAELVTVAADAVVPVSSSVDPFALAALGLGGVTAYEGLRRIGSIEDKRILVTGAAGGVGSAAVGIARAQGATVIGVVSRAEQVDYVLGLGADHVVVSGRGASAPIEAACVDGVLDTVGSALFQLTVAALKPGGTLSLVGAVGGSDVHLDLWELLQPITLTGYSSENLDGVSLLRAVSALTGWLENRAIAAPVWTTIPLAETARAHAMLERRGVSGRVLLIP